jgi:hypothetical protein
MTLYATALWLYAVMASLVLGFTRVWLYIPRGAESRPNPLWDSWEHLSVG